MLPFRRHSAVLHLALVTSAACSDPAPPEPEVATIQLSVPDAGTSLRFRDPLIITASPQAALGVPLQREVSWVSVTPAVLTVQPLGVRGDSARIGAVGTGTGQVRVSAGSVTRTFQVEVQDTVYAVTVTPGSLSLVAGDTVTYRARVTGPPNADSAVTWTPSNPTVLETLESTDPHLYRVRVRTAGTVQVRATAVADSTKFGSSTITSQAGRLVFASQPVTTSREVPFSPAVSVEVQDAAGNRSLRAANNLTISLAPNSCGAELTGTVTATAQGGAAIFPGVAASARCQGLTVLAASTQSATPASSQSFNIIARSCDAVVPYTPGVTIPAQLENVDCVVMRDGKPYYVHTYVLTIPNGSPTRTLLLAAESQAFGPRVESYVWPDDRGVAVTDSLVGAETLAGEYALGPGTYRFVVGASASAATGAYSFRLLASENSGALCRIVTTPGVTIVGGTQFGNCVVRHLSRGGEAPGRSFLIYLDAGKSVQVTSRGLSTADTYLEALDVTNPAGAPALLHFDNNSGGGPNGTDAQLTVTPAGRGRFILIQATSIGGGQFGYTVTISP